MKKIETALGMILRDDLLQIKEAQITLAQCIYQYPSGGAIINGKDYVDFWRLRDKEEVKAAMEIVAAAFNFEVDFKEV